MTAALNPDAGAEYLSSKTKLKPTIGIICGSGLSGLSKTLSESETFSYSDIPGFPDTTVPGHTGELVIGTLHGATVVCMRGRFHSYEGHDMDTVVIGVRVMARLGVKTLVVTNAAGGLAEHLSVGDIMIISDHINLPGLCGKNPLMGPNNDSFGPRFPPMSDAYCPGLRAAAYDTARRLNLGRTVKPKGVYCFVSGPSYETSCESLLLVNAGGCSVGMSTVPEVVAARHAGMEVLGLSLITNKVVLPNRPGRAASHDEVLDSVQAAAERMCALVAGTVQRLAQLDSDPVSADVLSWDPVAEASLQEARKLQQQRAARRAEDYSRRVEETRQHLSSASTARWMIGTVAVGLVAMVLMKGG